MRICGVPTPLRALDAPTQSTLLQFACWADAQEVAPSAVGSRDVRRYLAVLTERELSATTTARKLAAIRALFRSQREHGHIDRARRICSPRRVVPLTCPA